MDFLPLLPGGFGGRAGPGRRGPGEDGGPVVDHRLPADATADISTGWGPIMTADRKEKKADGRPHYTFAGPTAAHEVKQPAGQPISPLISSWYAPGSGRGSQAAGATGWIPSVTGTGWRPEQGAYAWSPREVVGPSSLQQYAAAMAPYIGMKPHEAREAHYATKRGMVEPGDIAASRFFLQGAGRGVTGRGLKENEALQEAIKTFESSISPQVLNQAALEGRDTGAAQDIALAQAKASYLMPTIHKALDIEAADLDRALGIAGQYAGLGGMETARRYQGAGLLADLAQAETARRAAGYRAGMEAGKVGRDIAQEQADAQEAERQRLIAAAERIGLGPLASIIPATIGSRTTTSSSKF